MCYGMGCPYENPYTGECRGDWWRPDAACKEPETAEEKMERIKGEEAWKSVPHASYGMKKIS